MSFETILTCLCLGFPALGVLWMIGDNIRNELQLSRLAERIFNNDKETK